MDPYWPMSNSLTLLPWCRLLMKLYGASPLHDIGPIIRALPGQFIDHMYAEATIDYPRFYYARFDDKSFLLIGGTENLAMAVQVINGYMGRLNPTVRDPQNEWTNDAAEAIIQRIRDAGFVSAEQLRICGHSIGGAIACVLPMGAQVAEWGARSAHALTFGSPKVHGSRPNRVVRERCEITRIMNDNDPVPFLPPSALDYPAMLGFIDPIHNARLSNFDHPTDAWNLAANGAMTRGVLPPSSLLTFGVNLASWLWDLDGFQNNSHSLVEYERRLIAQEATAVNNTHIRGNAIPTAPDSVRHDLTRQEHRVVEALAQRQRQQNGVPVHLDKGKIFEWVRVGRVNCVAFGGKLISITSTKRKAKRLANSGNDFLKVMQKMAVVDPIAVVSQFEAYFPYASEVLGNARPVMQTVFPAIGN